ncbi:hypothetical protein [Mycoplasma sp. 'Moose RK']|uniref:hypothetical protein n=1 Tax=Mycoplasma sp. 'Moose RK' TaxID=2780095 RepID=UPI0018C3031C|nr:hypothetical protein [Mycoplasma sp. 'Moose RK']MBG0730860.1 hypothetical protein [Mycoplasma sp. 'Moose RK']
MIFIDIIGWIATILTGTIGLPLVSNTFITKKPPKVSHLSWWIYYFGIFSFAFFGLAVSDLKMIITQVLSGLTTVIFLLQVYFFALKSRFSQNIIFIVLALLIYAGVLLAGILHVTNVFAQKQLLPASKYLGIISGFCVNIAFLPQTFNGIRQKTLVFIPIFFIINLFLLNLSWVIYESLSLSSKPDLLTALIFQSIGLLIATIQMIAYFYQIYFIKSKNQPVKINWF